MNDTSTTCGRTRRLLWPDAGPRAASPDVVAARRHLAGCAACRRFIEDMTAAREAMADAAPAEVVPAVVRDRVMTAVAHARTRPARWWRGRAVRRVIGGAVVAAAALTAVMARRDDDPLAVIAREHARRVAAADARTANAAALRQWLAGRVRFSIAVPALPGAALRGARVYERDGWRVAGLEYDVGGVPLSYVMVPSEESPTEEPVRFRHTRRGGYGVVSWHVGGVLHVLVGDFSNAELARLAKACVAQWDLPRA